MKRKNRLTVNFLCPGINSKKRKKFRISKETIPLQQPVVDRINDISDVPEAGIEFESQDVEESTNFETVHTKRKLKLADNWSEIRDSVYTTMISTHALRDAECFLCQAPATIRCIQCGPHLMCLQCCLQNHSMHNIHHYPEIWKVISYFNYSIATVPHSLYVG